MVRALLACMLLICPVCALSVQAGKLDKVRAEVRKPEAAPASRDDNYYCGCDDDEEDCSLLGDLLCACFSLLFQGADDVGSCDGPPPHTGYFLEYPYAQCRDGAMWIDDPEAAVDPDDDPLVKPWSVRLSVEESNDFDGLNRVNGMFLMENTAGVGLQGGWSILNERLDDGGRDSLVLADLNVTCRFLETERTQARIGLGCRMLADSGADWGINGTLSVDHFPCRPIVVSTLLDLGTLGDASVFHARATVGIMPTWGCHFRNVEIFGGYDYLRIGGVDLQGPLIGLRLWF